MADDVAVLLLVLAAENAELREQLSVARGMLVETAIDAKQLHARIKVVRAERDVWQAEAERHHTGRTHSGRQFRQWGMHRAKLSDSRRVCIDSPR